MPWAQAYARRLTPQGVHSGAAGSAAADPDLPGSLRPSTNTTSSSARPSPLGRRRLIGLRRIQGRLVGSAKPSQASEEDVTRTASARASSRCPSTPPATTPGTGCKVKWLVRGGLGGKENECQLQPRAGQEASNRAHAGESRSRPRAHSWNQSGRLGAHRCSGAFRSVRPQRRPGQRASGGPSKLATTNAAQILSGAPCGTVRASLGCPPQGPKGQFVGSSFWGARESGRPDRCGGHHGLDLQVGAVLRFSRGPLDCGRSSRRHTAIALRGV